MDPDYVLANIRYHIEVFYHDHDGCEDPDCGDSAHCSWDNFDTWQLLAEYGGVLDAWLTSGGRLPKDWTLRHRISCHARRVAERTRDTAAQVLRCITRRR